MIFSLLNALQTGNVTDALVQFTGYIIAIVIGISLHEFAHALWLEHKLMQHEYTVMDAGWVSRFEELAEACVVGRTDRCFLIRLFLMHLAHLLHPYGKKEGSKEEREKVEMGLD